MTLKTFFDNFDLLTDAPNAVVKLREIILQSAVRGKLVSQDPNDEPASVLVETIKAEKERLIGLNKKRQIEIDFQNEEPEYLNILPLNWHWTNLGTVGLINPRNELSDDVKVAFIPMNLIPQKYGDLVQWEVRRWGELKKGFTHFYEGDVALAKITPCFQNGKSCVMRGLKNKAGAGTTELHIFRSIKNLTHSEYVLIYFKSPKFIHDAIPIMTGTAGQKRVPNSYVADNPFPLPPLAEQRRIVENCDRLLSLCNQIEVRQQQRQESIVRMNESVIAQLLSSRNPDEFSQHWQRICNNFDLLYSIPETIPKLRQAILQLAVQGKLVPQNPNDEPAWVMLERIKAEKEQLVKEKKLPKDKQLPPVENSRLPYKAPEGWYWVRLGELAKVIEYGTSEKSSELGGEVPVFRMNNIRDGKLLVDDIKYVSAKIKDLPRLYLQNSDILFNRTNSYELVGKTGVFRGESNQYTFASYLIRTSVCLDYVSSEFINLAMNSTYFRQTQIEPEITQQCGQANFNGTKLKNTIIPLPPLAEQKRIVAKCDRLMSLCDTLEAKLKEARSHSEKLMEVAAKQVVVSR